MVTGAGEGIGRALAERFAAEGAKVQVAGDLDNNGSRCARGAGLRAPSDLS
jgi:NAD(P)-dependent dehydrogenase (short-subunit alcohol dehydrogenase family)